MQCLRSIPAVAGAVVALLLASGCAGGDGPAPSNTPGEAVAATPSPTALSEDEALAIAVATYEEFIAAEATLITSGGTDTAPMEAIITKNMADYYDTVLDYAKSDEFTVTGGIEILDVKVQQYSESTLTFYACLDRQNGHVLDSAGNSVGGNQTNVIQATEMRIVSIKDDPRVDGQTFWKDLEFCQQ